MRLIAFFFIFGATASAAMIRFEPARQVVPRGSVNVPVDVIVSLEADESLLGFDLDLRTIGTGFLQGSPFPAIDPLFAPVAGVDGDGFAGLFFGPPAALPSGLGDFRIATFAFSFPGSGGVRLFVPQGAEPGEELSGVDRPLRFRSGLGLITTPEPAAGALLAAALFWIGLVRTRRLKSRRRS